MTDAPENPFRSPRHAGPGRTSGATALETALAARRRHSFWMAMGFPMALAMLWLVDATFALNPNLAAVRGRRIAVLLCILLGAGASVLSVVAGCAPVAFGDRRPLRWLAPLALGWAAFLALYDWRSLFR